VDDLIESNHWKQAYNTVQAMLASNPKDAHAHAWMSKIKEGFDDLPASLAEAQKAVDLGPSTAFIHGQLAEACALTADVSSVVKGLGYVHCMKREVEAALKLDPKNIDTMLVYMLFSYKAPYFAGGDKVRAKKIAEDIKAIAPSWGYLAAARLLQDVDNDPLKEDLLKKAVDADPKFYRARMALANFYAVSAKQKRWDLAEKLGRGMIELDRANEGGYEILARVFAVQSRWQELDEILDASVKAVPEDLGPFYAAAEVLSETGADSPRAGRYLERYLTQPPEARQPTHAKARTLQAKLSKNL
jgi:tetratricopeptide (TPR) repeat protein